MHVHINILQNRLASTNVRPITMIGKKVLKLSFDYGRLNSWLLEQNFRKDKAMI